MHLELDIDDVVHLEYEIDYDMLQGRPCNMHICMYVLLL